MTASMQAFEHFVETGRVDYFPPQCITYEVGIDEMPHPDPEIAQRFEEVAMSTCRYGCKIYADPRSQVRVLVHSRVYGCVVRTTN
jgi:hypothetical protein